MGGKCGKKKCKSLRQKSYIRMFKLGQSDQVFINNMILSMSARPHVFQDLYDVWNTKEDFYQNVISALQ